MKNLIICTLFIVAAWSCKKDNGPDFTNYLRAKVDGTAQEFSTNIMANTPEPMHGHVNDPTLRITGNGLASIRLMMLSENQDISLGIYNFREGQNRSGTIMQNGESDYAGPPGPFSPDPFSGNGRTTIQEISDTYVKGTFEFTIEAYRGIIKPVTDGNIIFTKQKTNYH